MYEALLELDLALVNREAIQFQAARRSARKFRLPSTVAIAMVHLEIPTPPVRGLSTSAASSTLTAPPVATCTVAAAPTLPVTALTPLVVDVLLPLPVGPLGFGVAPLLLAAIVARAAIPVLRGRRAVDLRRHGFVVAYTYRLSLSLTSVEKKLKNKYKMSYIEMEERVSQGQSNFLWTFKFFSKKENLHLL